MLLRQTSGHLPDTGALRRIQVNRPDQSAALYAGDLCLGGGVIL